MESNIVCPCDDLNMLRKQWGDSLTGHGADIILIKGAAGRSFQIIFVV